MVYFWRILAAFSVLNLMNIIAVDGGAGMEPIITLNKILLQKQF
jgi:hypothetical protein